MNIQEIYGLLDKYYKGETSVSEEKLLRQYFSQESVPAELDSEKEIFAFYSSSAEAPAPSKNFEKRIIDSIDKKAKAEPEPSFSVIRSLYTLISSAAAILLIIGAYFIFAERSRPADTFNDPELAYAETVRILYKISSSLNNGIDALEPVIKLESATERSLGTISRSTGMIEKNLKPLDYFQKAIYIVNSPMKSITK